MNRDIKTKPVSRTPREPDKASRLPKEIVRRGLSDAREKLAGSEPESAGQGGAPENYATDKAQDGMEYAGRKTGDAVSNTAGKVKDRIVKGIKERGNTADTPGETHTGQGTSRSGGRDAAPKGNGNTIPTKHEQATRSSAESGRRRIQQMARERRALRNTDTARPAANTAKPAVNKTATATKTAAKGTVKTSKKTVKTTRKTMKATGRSVKTAKKTARTAAKTARQTAKAARQAVRTAKAAAKAAAQAAKATAKAIATGIKLAIAAIKGLIAAIAAGGWVVVLILLVIVAIAAIFASPSGILVGGGADGTPTVAEAVRTVNEEMYEKVQQIQARHSDAAEVHITYNGDEGGQYVEHWVDVLGVFAVKCNLDPENPQDVVVLDEARMTMLSQVFWDMVTITYDVVERDATAEPSASPAPSASASLSATPEPVKEKALYIHINSKGYESMSAFYNFTVDQVEALNALMEPDMRKMLLELMTLGDADLMLTPREIAAITANLPPNLSPSRRAVVLTAHSLVGKINYFWGGKSEVIGWDPRWGLPKKVTSGNSPTTGTTRPFGMDCSGFVTWTFINAARDKSVASLIGHGTANQFPKSTAIAWEEAQPGDLAFFSPPGGNNHVGVVVAVNADGSLMICHCSSSKNNVVVTQAVKGKTSFKYIRRPDAFYAIYP